MIAIKSPPSKWMTDVQKLKWTVFLLNFYQTDPLRHAVRDIIQHLLKSVMQRFFSLKWAELDGKTAEKQPVWRAVEYLKEQFATPGSQLANYIASDHEPSADISAVKFFEERVTERNNIDHKSI